MSQLVRNILIITISVLVIAACLHSQSVVMPGQNIVGTMTVASSGSGNASVINLNASSSSISAIQATHTGSGTSRPILLGSDAADGILFNNTTDLSIPSISGLTIGTHAICATSSACTYLYDSIATNNSITMRRADGTRGAPSAVQNGETLGHIGGAGYGSTGYTGIRSALDFVATQTWTDAAQGARVTGYGTPNGSTTPALVFAYDGVGVFGDAITIGNAPATNTKNYLSLGTVAVGSLPVAGATNQGQWISVTNSTAIAAEGQVCAAGGASVVAAAFSNGTVWKCF